MYYFNFNILIEVSPNLLGQQIKIEAPEPCYYQAVIPMTSLTYTQ